jgi:HlyD family secretion protein
MNNQAADLAIAEANLRVIETEINQYAFITSPIDGIVLDRRINIGDSVVDSSSMNSSAIFTLAENLREMQIEATVGELDVASITKGQMVRFTLESLTGRTFAGEVETLRMVPVVSNNVVSYTVIIKVENHDGTLLPGMTCAVDFIVEHRENVLMVSNAALRYRPTTLGEERIEEMVFNASLVNLNDEQRQAAIEAREQARAQAQAQSNAQSQNSGITGLMMGGGNTQQANRMMGGGGGRQRQNPGQQGQREGGRRRSEDPVVLRNIWFINEEGRLDVMQVRTGITNGSSTEIRTREDIEGMQIILRERIL